MTAATRREFAAQVRGDAVDLGRAALLLAAEATPELDVDAGVRTLDELAAAAAPLVGQSGADPLAAAAPLTAAEGLAAAESLREALGGRAGFAGFPEDYADLRASLLSEVLRRRRGLPILLSVVWLEVARRLGVPAYGVGIPGHFVVGIGRPGPDAVLVDPFRGGSAISRDELAARAAAAGAALQEHDLAPWTPQQILLRMLTNIRAVSSGIEEVATRLWAVELSLLIPNHPLQLRRERGHLLVRVGDFRGGAAELAGYASIVADVDPAEAQEAERESRMALARMN
ncbi:MAG: transglutaminase-like domain-containing protein [Actinomycetota bacterium]|nr:transglutaminase-like domain-containing protein [Actinomycetota bacterium]